MPIYVSLSMHCRVAFWQQVASQQRPAQAVEQLSSWQQSQLGSLGYNGDSTVLSRQLHQLAWSSILLASSARAQQHQQQQEQQTQRFPGLGGQVGGPGAALRQKLHTYLAAHMQWRQQQQYAPPQAPAEKWVTLEHEEQVRNVTVLVVWGLLYCPVHKAVQWCRACPAVHPHVSIIQQACCMHPTSRRFQACCAGVACL